MQNLHAYFTKKSNLLMSSKRLPNNKTIQYLNSVYLLYFVDLLMAWQENSVTLTARNGSCVTLIWTEPGQDFGEVSNYRVSIYLLSLLP